VLAQTCSREIPGKAAFNKIVLAGIESLCQPCQSRLYLGCVQDGMENGTYLLSITPHES
jgi:hypothetical protein